MGEVACSPGMAQWQAARRRAGPALPRDPPTHPPSLSVWVTLGIFILISGPLGWAAIIFICLAALVLLIVNTKIFSITR